MGQSPPYSRSYKRKPPTPRTMANPLPMKITRIIVVVAVLTCVIFPFLLRQRQSVKKTVENPTVNLGSTNSDLWNVGPVSGAADNLPDLVKYNEQIGQIKWGITPAQIINGSSADGRLIIFTNSLADGSRRLVIVDKVAGTFCLRDKSNKNVWAKSMGIKGLGSRNNITAVFTTSNMIGLNLDYSSDGFYDLESGEFIWRVTYRRDRPE
jgi:hypothetical protein